VSERASERVAGTETGWSGAHAQAEGERSTQRCGSHHIRRPGRRAGETALRGDGGEHDAAPPAALRGLHFWPSSCAIKIIAPNKAMRLGERSGGCLGPGRRQGSGSSAQLGARRACWQDGALERRRGGRRKRKRARGECRAVLWGREGEERGARRAHRGADCCAHSAASTVHSAHCTLKIAYRKVRSAHCTLHSVESAEDCSAARKHAVRPADWGRAAHAPAGRPKSRGVELAAAPPSWVIGGARLHSGRRAGRWRRTEVK